LPDDEWSERAETCSNDKIKRRCVDEKKNILSQVIEAISTEKRSGIYDKMRDIADTVIT
jgi:hypothetical protein